MDVTLLTAAWEVKDNPGLDTLDPRLTDVASLAQAGDFTAAGAQAESILAAGTYDVRLLGYFCFGVFAEQGFAALAPLLTGLGEVLRNNWNALGPVANRPRHAQTSLGWFLKQLFKKVQHEETTKGPEWSRWSEEVTVDQVGEVLEAGDALRRAMVQVLEEAAAPLLDTLLKLTEWLRAFQRIAKRPEVQAVAEDGAAEEAQAAGASAALRAVADPAGESHPLMLLKQKLAAFEQLVQEGKFPRAAIVADDLNETIAHFDPRLYFPDLFAGYVKLFALNVGELMAFEDRKAQPEWRALVDYYQIDLPGFLKL